MYIALALEEVIQPFLAVSLEEDVQAGGPEVEVQDADVLSILSQFGGYVPRYG